MNGLKRLGQQIASEQDALRAREPLPLHVREHMLQLQPHVASSARRRLGFALAGLAAASCAAVALLLWLNPAQWSVLRGAQGPLTLSVGESATPAGAGTWVEASSSAPLPMRFSDGTRIDIAPSSRARVVELQPNGAHLLLESGLAHVKVTRRPHAAWRLSAGPFAVRVTGTRFDVRWNPEQDDFSLTLTEGHVEVSGCVFGQGYRMSAGQTVHASCSHGHFDVVADKPAADVAVSVPPPAAARASDAEPLPGHARVSAAHPLTPEHAVGWRALAEQGKYADALLVIRAAGWPSSCAQASASDLELLAETARYARDATGEALALHSLRRRFGGTQSAALAAFALGRLEFDDHGSYRKAAGWFRTYLKEQPRGALVREACGRLLEATLRAGDVGAAHSLAQQYLRDYPSGPHAKLAYSIVASHEP